MGRILKIVALPMVVFLALVFSPAVYSMDWIAANQASVAWDAFKLSGGNEGDISYDVYTRNVVAGSPTVLIDNTANTGYTLTFNEEGRFLVGVRTVRVAPGETGSLVSDIVWSDSTVQEHVPIPFGIVSYTAPYGPKGFSAK